MKILILNWRDIKNPSSGGAEILTHEIAKRWVKYGHTVTQFSSMFKGAPREEVLDGIRVIRRGHPDARYLFGSVHFLAFLNYMISFRNNVDVVLDEIHGLPFFTPLYVKEKKVALICEVAVSLWNKLYGPIFGTFGRIIELFYLRTIYKNVHFMTISESSKKDLIKNGILPKHITVLPMGITTPLQQKKYEKEDKPTLIYVGRLSKSKGIEDTILGFNKVRSKIPESVLWIVGRGDSEYVTKIHELVKKLNLERFVIFLGFVSEDKKFELMSRSHILISASLKEGFGLTIPEAGSVYTPAVVYRTAGLSDIVTHGKSGIICKKNTPEQLASEIIKLLQNSALYKVLQTGAKRESKKYTWDKTAKHALSILLNNFVT